MKKLSLTRISIRNAEFYAYHGVREEEKKLGGKYQVDLDLYYDAKAAILRDDVKYALNYEEAMYCIAEIISADSYDLIETVANEILNLLMEKFAILRKATVKVRKMNVPMRRIISHIETEQTIERNADDPE